MSDIRIIPHEKRRGQEMEKRTYLPFTIESTCPTCGVVEQIDLSKEYLSYPRLNDPERVTFIHETDDGEHEWHETVVIGMTLEVAP